MNTPARHIPVGRITAVLAVAVGAFLITHRAAAPRFRTLAPGLEFAMIHGEPFCRSGSPEIAVLRIDPAHAAIGVRHYTREPDHRPLNVVEWQARTHALAVFNAGQYYPDYSYMGLLVSAGEVVSARVHPLFKAALVATPTATARVAAGPSAAVLDLSDHLLDPAAPGWNEVAQSFMLFDRHGELRVRKSSAIANRTAVGEDHEGRLVVLTSEGGYTLFEFAGLLKSSPLRLTHAMSMDGGEEAELCVAAAGFHYASFGPWTPGVGSSAVGAEVPLPAVITVGAR